MEAVLLWAHSEKRAGKEKDQVRDGLAASKKPQA